MGQHPGDLYPPPGDRYVTRPEDMNELGFSALATYHRMAGPNGGAEKYRLANRSVQVGAI